MEHYLIDTSAILDLLKGGKFGFELAQFLKGSRVLTSIICYCEVLNKSNLKKQAVAKEFLSSLEILPVTLVDGAVTEEIQNSCRKTGKHVSTTDCIIAATALNHKATIITTDSDFERIEGVKKHVF